MDNRCERATFFSALVGAVLLLDGCAPSVPFPTKEARAEVVTTSSKKSKREVYSKRDIVLCVDHWEGLTNLNGTGSYLEVVKKALEPEYKVKIKFFPWARAQAEFRNKRCDGLIAENTIDENFVKPQIILDALELEAYFLKGKTKFKGSDSLKKNRIGWLRGYGFDLLVPYPMKFTEVNDVKAGFKMLVGERFDIFLDYSYTFKDECATSGVDCSRITSKPSGVVERVWVVFHNDTRGKALAGLWDKKMTELIQAGVPQKIFEKYDQKYTGPY